MERSRRTQRFVALDNNHYQILIRSSVVYIEKSLKFIQEAIKSGKISKEKGLAYMNEILHCLFFIGLVNFPTIHPDDILPENLAQTLKNKFQDPFQKYKTQLPARPPYSILLDVVIQMTGEKYGAVLNQLLDLNKQMHVPQDQTGRMCANNFSLASTVVSHCHFEDRVTLQKTKSYFGASVSCQGKIKREIFIDLSCVHTWNRNVALAVCLAASKEPSIMLPQYIKSAAHSMLHCPSRVFNRPTEIYHSKAPCCHCLRTFPNIQFSPAPQGPPDSPKWECGNCAECEAVSKLLNAEDSLNWRVTNSNQADPSLMDLLHKREERLLDNLSKTKFEGGQVLQFYNPSRPSN